MIESNPTNVITAFEMLLEELEAEIDFVDKIGAQAFQARDYGKARECLEQASRLTAFRDKTDGLRKEWLELSAFGETREDDQTRAERRNLGRLRRGLRTPEDEFRRPILQALAELGGAADINKVLERVLQLIKPCLKEVDFDPLNSDPDMPRWRNTAQWARNSMAREGLLKADSPRGTWEISDKGQEVLAKG